MANETFTVNVGETATYRATVTTLNPGAQATPVNLSGKQLYWIVKINEKDDDSSAVITKSVGSGITISNAAQGLADIDLYVADTENLSRARTTRLHWSLRMAYDSKYVYLAEGILAVTPK